MSVVIPCLNEAETIEECVSRARGVLEASGLSGEVIVADNGSDDDSAALARDAGAHVVHEPRRGYGSAYLAGFAAAQGDYIVMADADLTYDFGYIPRFVGELDGGAEMVIGDRMDNIQPGAMPWLHRYVGNPILTRTLNVFFRTGVKDAHCGMRAFRRDVLPRLDLRTTGMEFASEMVIRAAKANLEVTPVPDRVPPARRRVEALELPRRLAPPALPARPQPDVPLHRARGGACRALGALAVLTVLAQIDVLGPHVGPARDDRRRAADDRRASRCSRSACAPTRTAPTSWASGPVVRPDARPLPARARPAARWRSSAWAGVVIAGVITGIWIDRGFGELSEERLAVLAATLIIVGHPDLLLVVPALDPRPATPALRRTRSAPR